MSGCKIGKVTFKNGTTLKQVPIERRNFHRVNLGWGEVVFRTYDGEPITTADINYMCDSAKHINMVGE